MLMLVDGRTRRVPDFRTAGIRVPQPRIASRLTRLDSTRLDSLDDSTRLTPVKARSFCFLLPTNSHIGRIVHLDDLASCYRSTSFHKSQLRIISITIPQQHKNEMLTPAELSLVEWFSSHELRGKNIEKTHTGRLCNLLLGCFGHRCACIHLNLATSILDR